MTRLIALTLAAAVLAGCAKPPSSIAPTAVSTSNYDGYSCAQLQAEIGKNMRDLSDAEARQRAAVAGDAVGVFLVLIPPSAFLGDATADVALHKGEDLAMQATWSQRCQTGGGVTRDGVWAW